MKRLLCVVGFVLVFAGFAVPASADTMYWQGSYSYHYQGQGLVLGMFPFETESYEDNGKTVYFLDFEYSYNIGNRTEPDSEASFGLYLAGYSDPALSEDSLLVELSPSFYYSYAFDEQNELITRNLMFSEEATDENPYGYDAYFDTWQDGGRQRILVSLFLYAPPSDNPAPTPEPSAFLLMALGSGALLFLTRRKKEA